MKASLIKILALASASLIAMSAFVSCSDGKKTEDDTLSTPTNSYTVEEKDKKGTFSYKEGIGDTAIITGFTQATKTQDNVTIEIPDTIDERTVVGIDDEAFYSATYIVGVKLPETIETIGNYAFAYCKNLASINIPENVKTVGDFSFAYCEALTKFAVTDKTTYIGEKAFAFCLTLESCTIGSNVETIGSGAFLNCEALKSLTIPESVKSVGDQAFCNCKALETLEFKADIESENIGKQVFSRCPSTLIFAAPEGSNILEAFNARNIIEDPTVPTEAKPAT